MNSNETYERIANNANYNRIANYDFSDIVLTEKIIVKFKIKKDITPYDFLTLFYEKKGERFAIKTNNKKDIIIGIGHEYTWNFETNSFLANYDNQSVLEEFESLVNQSTEVNIDDLSDEYFGVYGGISDGENKNSQEWIDFSDTMFVIPSILAVFKEEDIEFTLFFKLNKNVDFLNVWQDRISFLKKIMNFTQQELLDPKVKKERDIYPEVWQKNIELALNEIALENFNRISLARKNQIVLERDISLATAVRYFINKKLSFIAFEAKNSLFVTNNPLQSLSANKDKLEAYIYLQKEDLRDGQKKIDFKEEDIEKDYKNYLEEITGYNFELSTDKTLVGQNLDIYSVLSAKRQKLLSDIKVLSLLYPYNIVKGYPYDVTSKFLKEHENISCGFWYAPVGYINKNFDANFYTCGSMLVAFKNILTMYTTIIVNDSLSYSEIIQASDTLVEKNLKLFRKEV